MFIYRCLYTDIYIPIFIYRYLYTDVYIPMFIYRCLYTDVYIIYVNIELNINLCKYNT